MQLALGIVKLRAQLHLVQHSCTADPHTELADRRNAVGQRLRLGLEAGHLYLGLRRRRDEVRRSEGDRAVLAQIVEVLVLGGLDGADLTGVIGAHRLASEVRLPAGTDRIRAQVGQRDAHFHVPAPFALDGRQLQVGRIPACVALVGRHPLVGAHGTALRVIERPGGVDHQVHVLPVHLRRDQEDLQDVVLHQRLIALAFLRHRPAAIGHPAAPTHVEVVLIAEQPHSGVRAGDLPVLLVDEEALGGVDGAPGCFVQPAIHGDLPRRSSRLHHAPLAQPLQDLFRHSAGGHEPGQFLLRLLQLLEWQVPVEFHPGRVLPEQPAVPGHALGLVHRVVRALGQQGFAILPAVLDRCPSRLHCAPGLRQLSLATQLSRTQVLRASLRHPPARVQHLPQVDEAAEGVAVHPELIVGPLALRPGLIQQRHRLAGPVHLPAHSLEAAQRRQLLGEDLAHGHVL